MDDLSVDFDKCLSDEEFENGELLHHDLENRRRLVMLSSLTKNKSELRVAMLDDPESFRKTMKTSVEVYDHYLNIIELLAGGMARLMEVTKEINAGAQSNNVFDAENSSILKRLLKHTNGQD